VKGRLNATPLVAVLLVLIAWAFIAWWSGLRGRDPGVWWFCFGMGLVVSLVLEEIHDWADRL
jgi:hypothetical protein